MDPKRSLSEISHLFLSEVRGRQTGPTRPTRIPPPRRQDVSIDLTPEEFAASLEAGHGQDSVDSSQSFKSEPAVSRAPARVSIVISAHLGINRAKHIRQYARHLAGKVGHIGLIEADISEFGLTCMELNGDAPVTPVSIEPSDIRRMTETLAELAFDVERWLISLGNTRLPEARQLLQTAPSWVLLTTADDEGVVATYRALKGLAELGRPRLSLAVLDARDDAHAEAVFRKLDAVSRQFLGCGLESEPPVHSVQNVTEHAVLHCSIGENKNQSSPAPHWRVVEQFLSNSVHPQNEPQTPEKSPEKPPMKLNTPETPEMAIPTPAPSSAPKLKVATDSVPEVIELTGDADEKSVLEAVVRQGGAAGRWVLCPIHPPMCPQALLAVGRDHRLELLAIAGRGLSELRAIGLSLKWMAENMELIRMALPQLAIDAACPPAITLLVDQNDLGADAIQSLLQSDTITVQTYRRLKWGAKSALLLEAA